MNNGSNKRSYSDLVNYEASTSQNISVIGDLESTDEEGDNYIDPETLSVFENSDEIREFIEKIVLDRANEEGIIYEPATENDRKCNVIDCNNKAHSSSIAKGFCQFHSSVGHCCLRLVNARICATQGCKNKCRIFEKVCGRCSSFGTNDSLKEKCQIENRWSEDKVLQVSHEIATKYSEMVKKDDSILVYFGITIRPLQIRLNEHYRTGKDYDEAVLEIKIEDANSLADVEFETIAQFAEIAGAKHLLNKTAGGDYYLKNMQQSGVLYVLIFYNRVTVNTPTPNINFRSRRGFRQRSFPIVTQKKLIDLPRFKKIVTLSDIMHKLGYEVNLNFKQAPKHRKTGHRCEKCRYVGETLKSLEAHMNTHREKQFLCHRCGHPSSRLQHLRIHLKTTHGEDL